IEVVGGLQGEPPPDGHVAQRGLSTQFVSSTFQCIRMQGCMGTDGAALAEVIVKNIVATVEDNEIPTVTVTPPSPNTPLTGTVQIPYEAEDEGGGVAIVNLATDGRVIASDHDSNGGFCQEPLHSAAPCRLNIADRTIPLDTTQLPDGPHELTPLSL